MSRIFHTYRLHIEQLHRIGHSLAKEDISQTWATDLSKPGIKQTSAGR